MSPKRGVKAGIAALWWSANRLASLVGLGKSHGDTLTILYYHAVRPAEASLFAAQLDAILAYGEVVEPSYAGKTEGKPKVAVTFDDAFISVIENALPALEARGMPLTIFVPTRRLGAPPGWEMEYDAADREEEVASADQIRALSKRGVLLGAHSQTHPRMTRLDPEAAVRELSGSKSDLEELTGETVDLFAFPYGDYNDAVVEAAGRAGFRFAFSTQPNRVDPRDLSVLRPRVAVHPSDTPLEFWLKLRGGYEWMPTVSRLKHRFVPRAG